MNYLRYLTLGFLELGADEFATVWNQFTLDDLEDGF